MAEQIEVKVGQIWADADPRSSGRRIRITEVQAERARGVLVAHGRNVSPGEEGQRTRWIRLTRFRPHHRGYRLVENPDTGTAVAS